MMRLGWHLGPLVFTRDPRPRRRRRPQRGQPTWFRVTAAIVSVAGVITLWLLLT